MKNGIYVVKLDLRDEYEIAELFNGKWNTFRSLQQKFSEKDIIHCQITMDYPEKTAEFTISFPDQDILKNTGTVFAKRAQKIL